MKVTAEQSDWTNEIIKEDLVKIAEHYYAEYNPDEDCTEAIEKDVKYAMEHCLDLHEWEEYTVKPHAKNF